MSGSPEDSRFVGRAGWKLSAALDAFEIDVSGMVCGDFGCNVGGFTDCPLQRGARKVYAVDTGYGQLAWKLRTDPRVCVMERTNALYVERPEPVDLVAIDLAWTPQRLAVPAAAGWLRPGGPIVSLLKPHYELAKRSSGRKGRGRAPLDERRVRGVLWATASELGEMGFPVRAMAYSPLLGKGGNPEALLWIAPTGGERR